MKPFDIDLKNASVNYNLNGKELREALGRKPEDSLDDYKDNMCLPIIVRRDFDREFTDKEWEDFCQDINSDDGFFNEVDNTLAYYLDKMERDRKTKKMLEFGIDTKLPHTVDVFIESYNNLKVKISDEDYNKIQKASKDGKIEAEVIDDIINKNVCHIVDEEVHASKYVDITLDSKGDINANIAAKNFPIDIDDKLMPATRNIESEDLRIWRQVAYRLNKK